MQVAPLRWSKMKSYHVRIAAVIAYCQARVEKRNAVAILKELITPAEFQQIRAPDQFIIDNHRELLEKKKMFRKEDRQPPSRVPRVPDSIARACAAALKTGYTAEVRDPQPDGSGTVSLVHRYYDSITDACRHNATLAQVIQDYGVTPEHLLRRMHQVDRCLAMRTVEYKHQLTAQQQADRRYMASLILAWCCFMPDLLLRVWWIDECSMWIVKSGTQRQKVYCDAHDQGVKMVLTSPHVGTHDKIKVHLLAAVNALLGPCFYEFTTGTTQIHRRMLTTRGPYLVSG